MTRAPMLDRVAPLLALLAALAVAFALFPSPAHAQTAHDVAIERLEGDNRYATAAAIALGTFEAAEDVVIASGEAFPDALSGNYLAGLLDAPLLLLPQSPEDGALQADTQAALDELAPARVWILGGEAAIDTASEALLDEDHEVERIEGEDRYATSAAIATAAEADADFPIAPPGEEAEQVAIVATGERFPDALAAGPVAYSQGFPVLLTPTASLHDATAAALGELEVDRVIIAGGPAAVSEEVERDIAAMDIETERIFGLDRWETAIAFTQAALLDFGYTFEHLNVATGHGFPDALAMGPHGGVETSPILLTNGDDADVVETLTSWLQSHACGTSSLHVAGGVQAVPETHRVQLHEAASDCRFEGAEFDPPFARPGDTVWAALAGEQLDPETIASVAVAGECVTDGVIHDPEQGVDEQDEEGRFPFEIEEDAAPGECELSITVTFDDGVVQAIGAQYPVAP